MAGAEGKAGAEQLLQWWPSEVQRRLRNTCGITKDQFDMLATEWRACCEELAKEA
jgi:hypothetical protein